MELTDFKGMKVFVKLISDRFYDGVIDDVQYLGTDVYLCKRFLITLIDKYGQIVCFSNKEIKFMEQKKNKAEVKND